MNCGQLREAIAGGCETVESLSSATGASTVCGTCRPQLAELLDSNASLPPEQGYKPVIVASVLGLLLALLMIFSPRIPMPDTVQLDLQWQKLWTESLFKQISGFSLLGLSVIAALLSLRKRIKWVSFSQFWSWRVIHVVIGALLVMTLIVHTGFRLGSNLNFWLMTSFSGMLISGALIGILIGRQHLLSSTLLKRWRGRFFWAHILLFWPIPALLGFHVLKTYYF